MADAFDVIVIGGGIAGVGVASELAAEARTLVLERETAPGSHATGRSAAMFLLDYGNATIRALSAASEPFYRDPDPEFWPHPLLTPRGELLIARPGEEQALARHLTSAPAATALTAAEAAALVPILRREATAGAAHDPQAADIDVDRLLQGCLRRLRRSGGRLEAGADVRGLAREGGGWTVATATGRFVAPIVVDAAGAWADTVAALAGLPPLGLVPLRRSAAILPPPAGEDVSAWPLFGSIVEDWYARPTGGKLMISPADEEPVEPHDAWADDLVLAEGIARYEAAVTAPVTRVERSWAGLRTFAPDRTPVAGFDPLAPGFFWLAGQGGYGLQTAPALSRLAAGLVLGRRDDRDTVLAAALAPERLRSAAEGAGVGTPRGAPRSPATEGSSPC